MGAGAQLSVPEMRRATRHPVDYAVIGEHRTAGDVRLHIANLSDHGFMAQGDLPDLARGERVSLRLPIIGRIEAHLIWTSGDRAGFQFERILRPNDFSEMIETMQPNPRLRAVR